MKDKKEFYNTLCEIDGNRYEEYKKLIGDFDFSRYVLKVSHIAAEGNATLFIVRVPQIIAAFPPNLFNSPVRRTALEDLLTRKLAAGIDQLASYDSSGISRRRLSVAIPGQKILPRTSLVLTEEYVEARIYVDLSFSKGRIDGKNANEIFFEELPTVVNTALIFCNLNEHEVERFVNVMEDADHVRQILGTRGLVGFAGHGSQLARLGHSDLPDTTAPTLKIPEDLAIEIDIPNHGTVKGFGIPSGLTIILGDAYSGRIELMQALAGGIYNHIPGDGRESVVMVPDAVHICSEPCRSVQRVDIRPFIRDMGNNSDAEKFTSISADPCTAQAASTVEALEAGARVLMFDESSSDVAFLSKDSRLAGLLPGAEERITALSTHARELVDKLGISLIISGSTTLGEYMPIADTILRIDKHKIYNITQKAKALNIKVPSTTKRDFSLAEIVQKSRWIVPTSLDPSSGKEDERIFAKSTYELIFGRTHIDLHGITQLADIYQTETVGRILYYAKLRYMDEGRPVREILELIDRDLSSEGLECLTRELNGNFARPRRYEIAAALNRLNTLRVSHTSK